MKLSLPILILILILLSSNGYCETLFMENWESNAKEHWTGESVDTGCTVDTSSTQANSGAYSLASTIDTSDETANMYYTMASASVFDEFYMRCYVYLPAAFLATFANGEYAGFFHTGDDLNQDLLKFGLYHDGSNIVFYASYDSSNSFIIDTAAVSADTWYCIDGYIKLDNVAGSAKFYVNGSLIGSDSGDTNSHTNSDLKYFAVGIIYTTGVTGTIYIDDCVVDTSDYIGTGWRIQEGLAVESLPYF